MNLKKGKFALSLSKGFTLIELLVVIAIIGILSGIILTSLGASRDKARDARIKGNVKSIRTQLELGFNGKYYPNLITSSVQGAGVPGSLFRGWNSCVETIPSMSAQEKEICLSVLSLQNDSSKQGGLIKYVINTYPSVSRASAFAVYGKLVSSPDYFFCIDSLENVNPKVPEASAVATVCPPAP